MLDTTAKPAIASLIAGQSVRHGQPSEIAAFRTAASGAGRADDPIIVAPSGNHFAVASAGGSLRPAPVRDRL